MQLVSNLVPLGPPYECYADGGHARPPFGDSGPPEDLSHDLLNTIITVAPQLAAVSLLFSV